MKHQVHALTLCLASCAAGSAQAQDTPNLDRMKQVVAMACAAETSEPDITEDHLVALAAASADLSLLDLQASTGVDGLAAFFQDGGRLANSDQGVELAEYLVAQTGVLPALEAQVRGSSTACDAFHLTWAEDMADTVQLQLEERNYYRPQAAAAQALLNFHGCDAGRVDGFFGPGSRAAWNSAVQDTRIPALRDGEQPLPMMIAELAEVEISGRLCERRADQTRADSHVVLRSMAACQSGQPRVKDLSALLRGVSEPETSIRRAMEASTVLCSNSWDAMHNARSVVEAVLRILKLRAATLEEAQAFVSALRASVATGVDVDDAGAIHGILAQAADNAAVVPEDRGHANVLALMHWERLHAIEAGDLGRAEKIVHVLGRGESGWPVSSEVQAYLSASYEGSKAQSQIWLNSHYLFAGFETAMETGVDVGPVAREIAAAYADLIVSGEARDVHAGGVQAKVDFTVGMDGLQPMIMVTRLVARDLSAAEDILQLENGQVNFVIGSMLLEGHAGVERAPAMVATARRLISHAADAGVILASLRLAQMAEQGMGGPVDLRAARDFYEVAASLGHPAAHLALGDFYRLGKGGAADPDAAMRSYLAALSQPGEQGGVSAEIFAQVWHRMQSRDPFFVTGRGADLIDTVYARFDAIEGEADFTLVQSFQKIGQSFFDPKSTLAPDPAEAVRWLRLAVKHSKYGSEDIRLKLISLLHAFPELAADAGELDRLHDSSDDGEKALLQAYRHARSFDADALGQWTKANCTDQYNMWSCVELHRKAAIGAFGPEMLKPGYDWLRMAAARERIKILKGTLDSGSPEDEILAIPALMDVTAFFGDYTGAQEMIEPLRQLSNSFAWNIQSARDSTFRREIARIQQGYDGPRRDELRRLLQALSVRGDDDAQRLLGQFTAAETSTFELPDVTLEDARERFALVEPLGQGALALPLSARRLARLEHAAGFAERALELELMALQSDMLRADFSEVENGPIAAGLTRVCVLSSTSERLYGYGYGDIALSLAKDAVNRLQDMRRSLTELPEDLQLCFRDQVADYYRWLADLFIAQDRPAEADQVLTMLKSFETFQFFDRDRRYSGVALDRMEQAQGEAELVEDLARQVLPTVTEQSLRRRALLLKKRDESLTSQEAAELEALQVALQAARVERDALLADLRDRAQAVGHASPRIGANSKSIKRHLRQRHGGKAATLQYVVLPDRIGAVLITSVSEHAFGWQEFKGQPFAETLLNEEIAKLRTDLQTPNSDPTVLAQELHDLLLPEEVQRELDAADVDTLILSLDRQLRYVPFAALHDGDDWLVSRYRIIHATEAQTSPVEELPQQAAVFGTTEAVGGFGALPAVADEVDALVGSDAVFDGRIYLNDAFTRDAISSSLIFDDLGVGALGVVHIASHFKLGERESESFLLLGTGDRLNLTDIREGFGVDLDLSEVGLLTLSACETGFGAVSADGRELESFAAIAQSEGAQSVVATLWPVADRSTSIFMKLFYDAQASGDGIATALSDTQRLFATGAVHPGNADDLLVGRGAFSLEDEPVVSEGFRHPFYWAPMIYLAGAS